MTVDGILSRFSCRMSECIMHFPSKNNIIDQIRLNEQCHNSDGISVTLGVDSNMEALGAPAEEAKAIPVSLS